jgi:hypothetical protein
MAGGLLGMQRMNVSFVPDVLLVAVCLASFVVVSGGFTEVQVTRYLGFVGCLGLIHVITALIQSRLRANQTGVWEVTSLFGPQWPTAAFLGLSLLATGTLAVYAANERSLDRDPRSMHSRVAWFSSPGVQVAVVAIASMAVIFLFLYLLPALWVLPMCCAAVTGWALVLAAKGKASVPLVLAGILMLLALNALSLGRPAGERFLFSGDAFHANLSRLGNVSARRSAEGSERPEPHAEVSEQDMMSNPGLRPLIGNRAGRVTGVLLGLFLLACAALGVKGLIRFEGSECILAAGGLFGLIGVAGLAALSGSLYHPGVAVTAAGFAAIAASQGSFEREVEA